MWGRREAGAGERYRLMLAWSKDGLDVNEFGGREREGKRVM